MSDLLDSVIEAHGGRERFNSFATLTAKLEQGGILWALKGKTDVLAHANVRVDLREERVSHWPFAPTSRHSVFTPQRVTIEEEDGSITEDLSEPRASFAGFEMETHWSDAQLAYFAGYTMWTYLISPFLLGRPGVVAREIESWEEAGENWHRLRVEFPDSIATHSKVQDFYFDDKGLLRRHDYEVEIQGNNAASRYLFEPVEVQGITLYSKMRIVPNTPSNIPLTEPYIVTIDLSDYRFE